ncbi:amino acid ABC transporter substrate-binding protein [Paenibacillus radicis (ex Gao et al. 2016)]|uniref:Amino acid ABC transporter substrate-binding protein n=1 Tax=Paenibacillus radicis (ex Gao et al. 2016) TaxID=1737354 RepID=A0A917LXK6_9BACL|nr:amino acid ABC transporter substrate-binding protein [Paenibacillus radicis (ex Gao et al. 2016)]GGG65641.1 amino acid ABC transporter substrate-binding protein [Paenibacillus radicis (ex Gao et al. 2016)]
MYRKKRGTLQAVLLLMLAFVLLLTACGEKSEKAGASAKGSGKKLVIGSTGGFYPYVFQNSETNKLEGFEVDLWQEIAKLTGYEVEWKTSEFSGLFGLLDTGKIDTIANSIAVTEERKQKYLFSEPYVYSGAQLVVKQGNEAIQSLESLKGKKIGIQSGTNFANLVKEFDKKGEIEIVNYETAEAGFQDVAIGRIDATFATKASALGTINKTKLPLQLGGKQLTTIPAANPFLNNDGNKELVNQVNDALKKLRENGKLAEISEKWFTQDLTNPDN